MVLLIKERLEAHQISLYFGAVLAAVGFGISFPRTDALAVAINPTLAFMLFVTFLQVPLTELGRAFVRWRFIAPLLAANFVAIPLLVLIMSPFFPADPLIKFGILIVLLTPCIDYVVTFAQLGKGDAKALLAASPTLLLLQMVLLPVFLVLFLGEEAAELVHVGPFLHAFLWLVVLPLALAGLMQFYSDRAASNAAVMSGLSLLPVPATAVVLFVVVAAVVPQIEQARAAVLSAVPFYIAFACLAPLVGWGVARFSRLSVAESRSLAFSTATRNSLVVLPLALAVPGAIPLLPAVVVAQTLVELVSELIYVRIIPRLRA